MKALPGLVAGGTIALVIFITLIAGTAELASSEPPNVLCGPDPSTLDDDLDPGEPIDVSQRLALNPTQTGNARLIVGIGRQRLAPTETILEALMISIAASALTNDPTRGLLGLDPSQWPQLNVANKNQAINAFYDTQPRESLSDAVLTWETEARTIFQRWGTSAANPTSCVSSIGPGATTQDDIVSVESIQIHVDIADELADLLTSARADGIELAGWGWRSHQRQHELRRINGCPDDGSWTHSPTESPAAWAPASACRLPTARPGFSNHESGYAVDFTYQGQTIRSRSGPAWNWLNNNANDYGFYNLPSEPWHWSTDGR